MAATIVLTVVSTRQEARRVERDTNWTKLGTALAQILRNYITRDNPVFGKRSSYVGARRVERTHSAVTEEIHG